MTKAAASLAVTLLALDALSRPCSAEAQPFAYPPKRVAWIVGQGLFNYNGRSLAWAAMGVANSDAEVWLLRLPPASGRRLAAGRRMRVKADLPRVR